MASDGLTFLDASVLIYAARKPTEATLERRLRALQVLGDPDRQFVASEFLRLELLPVPKYYNRTREVTFYEKFFSNVAVWVDDERIVETAYAVACQFGLGALDALHVAGADSVGAELISAEKPTKPIYRAYANISSMY